MLDLAAERDPAWRWENLSVPQDLIRAWNTSQSKVSESWIVVGEPY